MAAFFAQLHVRSSSNKSRLHKNAADWQQGGMICHASVIDTLTFCNAPRNRIRNCPKDRGC
jgi:hypothetical protein